MLSIVAVVAVVVLVAPAVFVLVRGGYTPVSDWALAELAARDTTSGRPALHGAWSRYGWAHPGPWVTWLLSVGYLATGRTAVGLLWSALLLTVVAAAVGVWLAARRHLLAGVAAVAGFALMFAWSPAPLGVFDPWNASLAVVLFALALVGVWAVLGGDQVGGWVAAVAGVLAAGSHIGYAPVIGSVFVAAVFLWWWRLRPGVVGFAQHLWSHRRSAVIGAGVAGTVLVVPLVVDAVVNPPGNVLRIVSWMLDPTEDTRGFGTGVRILGRAGSVTYPFDGFEVFFDELVTPIPVGVLPGIMFVVFAGAAWLGWSQRWVRDMTVVVAAGWSGVFFASANLRGPLLAWLVGWVAPLAALTWVSAVAAAAVGVWFRTAPTGPDARLRAARRTMAGCVGVAAVATVVVAGVPTSAATVRDPFVWTEIGDSVDVLVDAIDNVTAGRVVRVDFDGQNVTAGALHAAVVNELDRADVTVRVDDDLLLQYGAHRLGDHDITVVVAAEPVVVDRPANWVTLAVVDAAGADRERIDALTASLAEVGETVGFGEAVNLLTTQGADLLVYDDRFSGYVAELLELAELRRGGSDRYVAYLVDTTADP